MESVIPQPLASRLSESQLTILKRLSEYEVPPDVFQRHSPADVPAIGASEGMGNPHSQTTVAGPTVLLAPQPETVHPDRSNPIGRMLQVGSLALFSGILVSTGVWRNGSWFSRWRDRNNRPADTYDPDASTAASTYDTQAVYRDHITAQPVAGSTASVHSAPVYSSTDSHLDSHLVDTAPPVVGPAPDTGRYHPGQPDAAVAVDRDGDGRVDAVERRRGMSKGKVAALVGATALVSVVGTVIAMRTGFDINVPDWLEVNPDRYDELQKLGFDPPEITDIMNDPDFFDNLTKADFTPESIERVYENRGLYQRMVDAQIPDERIREVFSNPEYVASLNNASLADASEAAATFDNLGTYTEMVKGGLPPEAAQEAVSYPELVKLWEQNGENSRLMAEIFKKPEIFNSLSDLQLPYDQVRDIMLNPKDFDRLLGMMTDDGRSVSELVDAAKRTTGDAADTARSVGDVAGSFRIERGNGFTDELEDYLRSNGEERSGSWLYNLHERLLDRFGDNYIRGVPTYELPDSAGGGLGLARPGTGSWEDGVTDYINDRAGI